MARNRDYAAEYARRVARERERAAGEGRPFSLARARGHTSSEVENARRRERRGSVVRRPLNPSNAATRSRVKRLVERNRIKLGDHDYPDWEATKEYAKNSSWQDLERILRQQDDNIRRYKNGSRWAGNLAWNLGKLDPRFPIQFFYYHGTV